MRGYNNSNTQTSLVLPFLTNVYFTFAWGYTDKLCLLNSYSSTTYLSFVEYIDAILINFSHDTETREITT